MDFRIELTEFPSFMHENIYCRARRFMPLLNHAAINESILESWVALHCFVMDMLSDMYDHPEKYKLPYFKIEKFLDGRDIHDVKKESTAKLKRISSETTHAVGKYMASLTKTISENHPEMRSAMEAIPRWSNLMYDYRSLAVDYKPTFSDYYVTLFTESRIMAYELHDYALERKMDVSVNANWGVLYHYKSKHVLTVTTGDVDSIGFAVKVAGKGKKESVDVMENALAKETQEFQKQALTSLSGCDANRCLSCSCYSSGRYVTILGKRHQVCGEDIITYDFLKPLSADMGIIKRLIDMRCESADKA